MKETESKKPEIARRRGVIDLINPKPYIRKNAETASDWVYKDETDYL